MFTGQRKHRGIVIKQGRGFPRVVRMACSTGWTELLPVLVGMTTQTFFGQAKHGAVQVDIRFKAFEIFGDQRRLVTRPAFEFSMSTVQRKTGQFVIEFTLSLGPVDQLEVPSVVVAVAFTTVVSYTAIEYVGMVSPVHLQTGTHCSVAGQTLGPVVPTAEIMAACAICKSLEVLVRFGERSG